MTACILQKQQQFPIAIGTAVFLTEQYQLVGVRNYTEQTTIAGALVFTNHGVRARRLRLKGRFLSGTPAEIQLQMDAYLQNNRVFSAVVDGVRYPTCRICSYRLSRDGVSPVVQCEMQCLVTGTLTTAGEEDADGVDRTAL